MKVALIDTGISKNEINSSCEVRHFSLVKQAFVEEYKEPIKCSGGKWTISVKPFEIITVGCRKNIYQGEQYDETGI